MLTHPSFEVELADDALESTHQRPPQRRRIQIVQDVERQQLGHADERLVADAIDDRCAARLAVRHQQLVDDEVADLDVLLDAQHIVAQAGVAVAHQEHARLALGQQQLVGLLSRQLAVVPAGAVVHVERGVHGGDDTPTAIWVCTIRLGEGIFDEDETFYNKDTSISILGLCIFT